MFSSVNVNAGQTRTYGTKSKTKQLSKSRTKSGPSEQDFWDQLRREDEEFKENKQQHHRKPSNTEISNKNKVTDQKSVRNEQESIAVLSESNRKLNDARDAQKERSTDQFNSVQKGPAKSSKKLPRSPDLLNLSIPEYTPPEREQDFSKLISTAPRSRSSFYESFNDSFNDLINESFNDSSNDSYAASIVSDASTIQLKRTSIVDSHQDSSFESTGSRRSSYRNSLRESFRSSHRDSFRSSQRDSIRSSSQRDSLRSSQRDSFGSSQRDSQRDSLVYGQGQKKSLRTSARLSNDNGDNSANFDVRGAETNLSAKPSFTFSRNSISSRPSKASLTSSSSIRSFFNLKSDKASADRSTSSESPAPSFNSTTSSIPKKSSFMDIKKSFSTLSSSPSSFFRTQKDTGPSQSQPQSQSQSQNLLRRSFFGKPSSSPQNHRYSLNVFSSSSSPLTGSSSPIKSGHRVNQSTSQAIDRSMISLPTPVEESRERLHNKLRNSSSLWSLSQSLDTDEAVAMPVDEYEQSLLVKLLSICSSTDILPFKDYVKSLVNKNQGSLRKLAEASFSEVFAQQPSKSSHHRQSLVYKVIPFGNEELEQLPIKDIIQELEIARIVKSVNGFSNVLNAFVVQGEYPNELLELWDDYNLDHKSVNYRPDYFNTTQLYCVMVMADAGDDLENFELWNWKEAASVFWQTVSYLADAELKYQFEHRDLHWSNLLIKVDNNDSATTRNKSKNDEAGSDFVTQTQDLLEQLSISKDEDVDSDPEQENVRQLQVTLIDFTLSRATNANGNVFYTRMDHPDFFRGKGDYQFDVYRFMRAYFREDLVPGSNNHPLYSAPSMSTTSISSFANSSELNWSNFCPRTNVLWLHYLADKLLNSKNLTKYSQPGAEDYHCYKCISMIHKTLDPRRKVFVEKAKGGNSSSRNSTFQDFSSANDVLQWGVEHGLCRGL